MSARIRSTFPVFEITIAGALLLIGWAAFRLYEIVPEVDESRHALVQLRDEYFGLGDSVQTNMSELDDALVSYLDEKQDEDLERFQKQSAQWSQWLGERRRAWLDSELADSSATNGGAANRIENEMLPLLAKIELAYTNYLKPARFILSNTGRPFLKDQVDLREKATQRSKQRLMTLEDPVARLESHPFERLFGLGVRRFERKTVRGVGRDNPRRRPIVL